MRLYKDTCIQNATTQQKRDMAYEFDRTGCSNLGLAAVTGALRSVANEIDRLQKRLTEVLAKVAVPDHFL